MTTNSKNIHSQGTRSHPEPAVANTNANDGNATTMYEAVLHYTRLTFAVVLIEANSPEQAQTKAESIGVADITFWEKADEYVEVASIEAVSKGGRHE